MIKSMTGFGSAKGTSSALEISVEIKSVNSRYLDCTIKIPRAYAAFEDKIKKIVGTNITRGKVDVYVSVDSFNADNMTIRVNRPLAGAYVAMLRAMADEYGLDGNVGVVDVARFPDVLKAEKDEEDAEQLFADICLVLESALAGFNDMRIQEGEKLRGDIEARLDDIIRLTALAEEISPRSVEEYRLKLEAKMRDLLQAAEIDEQRILTEAAIFADRVAINEETVRLKSHVAQLRELLGSRDAVGRKIDFLVQEFNREANTIGSKGNDAEMSRVVVDLKAEIEKIREQAQNIE
ncbi:MAG: YicC family protein [Oscillospiraceae bacterium]|nr:YicC family protein [Oscillospiraceae bacterium]